MRTVIKCSRFVWVWVFFASKGVLSISKNEIELEPGHVKQDFECIEEVRGHNNNNSTTSKGILFRDKKGNKVDQDAIKRWVLDVGYYLRRFKFNSQDPRYSLNGETQERNGFAGFPSPPLKNIDWEVMQRISTPIQVKRNCESSFISCLMYVQGKVNRMILPRRMDSMTTVKGNGWSLAADENAMKAVENNCRELLNRDDATFGKLQKFRWLTSASYYMCLYTMREVDELRYFADDCDNGASCLEWNAGLHNGDFRGDNSRPFACALYSFCPDPCCPVKHAWDPISCFEASSCPGGVAAEATCRFHRKANLNLESMTLNHWNISCECGLAGMRWDSQSGLCADIDECMEPEPPCNFPSETCINLRGSYKCICSPLGYRKNPVTDECERDPDLEDVFYPREPLSQNGTEFLTEKLSKMLKRLKSAASEILSQL